MLLITRIERHGREFWAYGPDKWIYRVHPNEPNVTALVGRPLLWRWEGDDGSEPLLSVERVQPGELRRRQPGHRFPGIAREAAKGSHRRFTVAPILYDEWADEARQRALSEEERRRAKWLADAEAGRIRTRASVGAGTKSVSPTVSANRKRGPTRKVVVSAKTDGVETGTQKRSRSVRAISTGMESNRKRH